MKTTRPDDIPEDIYVGFVRSLYDGAGILLVGAFSHGIVGLLVYWKTQQPIYLILSLLMIAASLWRYYAMRKVDPSSIASYEEAQRRERYYIVAGTIQGLCAGLFAFVALYWVPDVFGEVAAVSALLASTITIAGRNFGSRKMVAILSFSVLGPIALGLMLKGDVYHFVLGMFIIPVMFTINKMAHLVRTVLFTAISEEKKANRIAERFNRALNTMSHGLVMLGPNGRVVVANAEAAHLMSFKSPDSLLGRSIHSMLMRGVAGGMLAPKDCKFIEGQLTRALREGRDRKVLVASDTVKVSRFGGDEFMMFVDHVEDESQLTGIIDRIFAGLQGEIDVAGHALRIQASGGAVLSRVRDTDVDAMIVKADLALYKAKELGKNDWRLFEASMDAAFRSRQLMKADLRAAIESNALRVVYQPIVAMDTMRIASCEALCRWEHRDLGPISPAVFIPLAEEMGMISEISLFVLQAACSECVRWPEQISVSVNLSAKDFRNRDVIDKVHRALTASGLAPHRLEVEVTETALLDDKSLTRQYVEELKTLGVRIALDDFGTGYSSLSYLHKLPLDKVKIDRSFLVDVGQNSRSLELLKGIVSLSRSLGLMVTIEGVETFEQLKVISLEIKPDLVQGFLFGSALTASGIETMANTIWPFAKHLGDSKRATAR
ncbi:MAG: EAL domain-containing protein [Hyphomicrobiales bacterium]|nr:EAL domain-containing protein [Hyphomicrobiales bacterium]